MTTLTNEYASGTLYSTRKQIVISTSKQVCISDHRRHASGILATHAVACKRHLAVVEVGCPLLCSFITCGRRIISMVVVVRVAKAKATL